ncbi:MAG: ribonuclease III [Tenuifilaceae bacterium]
MLSNILRRIRKHRVPIGDREFYDQLKQIFGIFPRNIEIYKLAVVHKSASVVLSRGKRVNNERLEYLGDAVLDAIVAEYLFAQYPNQKEGFLTKMRSKIVSRTSLNQLAIDMGLDKIIVKQAHFQHTQKNIYGNALEALIGALFIDQGYQFTSDCVTNSILEKYIDLDNLQMIETDYKSRIIEVAQKSRLAIQFQCQESESTNGNSPHFIATITLNDNLLGEGHGSSKKEAEQNAAMEAIAKVDDLPLNQPAPTETEN